MPGVSLRARVGRLLIGRVLPVKARLKSAMPLVATQNAIWPEVRVGPEAEVHGNETASDHALSGDVEYSCMVRAEFIW